MEVTQDPEATYGTLHPRSSALPDVGRDAPAINVTDLTARAASRQSDLHLSSVGLKESASPSAHDHSHSPYRPGVPPEARSNLHDHSGPEKLHRVPLGSLSKGKKRQVRRR